MNDGKITPPKKPGGPNSQLNYPYLVIMGKQVMWTTERNAKFLKDQKGGPTFTHFPATVVKIDSNEVEE